MRFEQIGYEEAATSANRRRPQAGKYFPGHARSRTDSTTSDMIGIVSVSRWTVDDVLALVI
jgi:hypothetical protein